MKKLLFICLIFLVGYSYAQDKLIRRSDLNETSDSLNTRVDSLLTNMPVGGAADSVAQHRTELNAEHDTTTAMRTFVNSNRDSIYQRLGLWGGTMLGNIYFNGASRSLLYPYLLSGSAYNLTISAQSTDYGGNAGSLYLNAGSVGAPASSELGGAIYLQSGVGSGSVYNNIFMNNSGGNVGINTSSATSKLTVGGGVKADSLLIGSQMVQTIISDSVALERTARTDSIGAHRTFMNLNRDSIYQRLGLWGGTLTGNLSFNSADRIIGFPLKTTGVGFNLTINAQDVDNSGTGGNVYINAGDMGSPATDVEIGGAIYLQSGIGYGSIYNDVNINGSGGNINMGSSSIGGSKLNVGGGVRADTLIGHLIDTLSTQTFKFVIDNPYVNVYSIRLDYDIVIDSVWLQTSDSTITVTIANQAYVGAGLDAYVDTLFASDTVVVNDNNYGQVETDFDDNTFNKLWLLTIQIVATEWSGTPQYEQLRLSVYYRRKSL